MIVIGAGVVGLEFTRRAQRSGLSVIVLEVDDAIGGRVRADRVGGSLCIAVSRYSTLRSALISASELLALARRGTSDAKFPAVSRSPRTTVQSGAESQLSQSGLAKFLR